MIDSLGIYVVFLKYIPIGIECTLFLQDPLFYDKSKSYAVFYTSCFVFRFNNTRCFFMVVLEYNVICDGISFYHVFVYPA